jgi:hypothetical protein
LIITRDYPSPGFAALRKKRGQQFYSGLFGISEPYLRGAKLFRYAPRGEPDAIVIVAAAQNVEGETARAASNKVLCNV